MAKKVKVIEVVKPPIQREKLNMTNVREQVKHFGLPKIDLEPWADRVILFPLEHEEKTKGGIIVPDTVKAGEMKPLKAIVVAAGPGDAENPMRAKRGMLVAYGKYSGTEYRCEGELFLLCRQNDLMGPVVPLY